MKVSAEQQRKVIRSARAADHAMTAVLYGAGIIAVGLLAALTLHILYQGFSGFYPDLLSAGENGILDQLFNTIYLVFLSLLVSVPIGIGAGIYLAEYAKPGRMLSLIRISIESLSSLPSIVVGLFGYLVFILMTGMKWNLMAGALSVSILSLPLITTETENALRGLPPGYKEGSLALGATHWTTIVRVMVPAAFPQILTGIIMAAGRGFGEAAALLYTAGQSTRINWSQWNLASPACPLNPFRPGETLALHIWVMRTEGSLNPNATEIAAFSSAVLVLLALVFSLVTRSIASSYARRRNGE